MFNSLAGRTVFITGAGSGIGRATALAFASHGARVACADLHAAEETAELVQQAGAEALALKLDVTDEAAVNAAIARIIEHWGRLDCAFNNAGISLETTQTPWDSIELYDRVVSVNQRGVLLCMAAELREMVRLGGGAIVNTASIAGQAGLSGPGYCGSKHAVIGLTRSAAMAYARRNIRINAVCPGVIATPMVRAMESDPQASAAIGQMVPMGRLGRAEEVAAAVVFLCSDQASFITGHPLAVDGGFLAR